MISSNPPQKTDKPHVNTSPGTFSEKVPKPHSTHAILPNLDFEYELAHHILHPQKPYKTPPPALRIIERWHHILRLIPGFENATPISPDPTTNTTKHSQILPWGVTPNTAALQNPTATNFPDFAAVARANDKRFSHSLETNADIALPHSCLVATIEQLEHAALSSPFDWVAKHPLGVSGRERILGKAHKLDPQLATWATRQFQAGWQLVFEPWVTIETEYSLQFEITPDGLILFLGACELITDSVGTFRGHRSLPPTSNTNQTAQTASQLAKTAAPTLSALFETGYFGPVGIDALTGHLGTQPITRPITEINARLTFGRLALELAKHVPTGWKYIWWHPSKSAAQTANLEILGPLIPQTNRPGTYLLPHHTDPHGRSQTLVLIAPQNTPFPHTL